jgi:hypothetical protein
MVLELLLEGRPELAKAAKLVGNEIQIPKNQAAKHRAFIYKLKLDLRLRSAHHSRAGALHRSSPPISFLPSNHSQHL